MGRRRGLINENEYKFLWVVDFPMFEYDEENKRWKAMHHPFTAPRDEDVQYLTTDPGRVKAKAYDMVLNGVEIGGGSLRIYNSDTQEKVFEAIGLTPEQAHENSALCLRPSNMVLLHMVDLHLVLTVWLCSWLNVILFVTLFHSLKLKVLVA